jgi:glycosyltransferase involved in cell wall biosynthesis
MYILYVLTRSDEIGGAQIHVRDMAEAMYKYGNKVTVAVGGDGPLIDQLMYRGIYCRKVPFLNRNINIFKDFLALLALFILIKKEKVDIVSLHSSKAGLLGRVASFMAGVPVVFTAHGWAFTEGVGKSKRKIYCFLERMAAYISAKIITVSKYDLDLAEKYKVGSRNQLTVIHNGMPDINPEYFARYRKCPCKIIMVARFSRQKNHIGLIEILGHLENTDWTLELIGGGPYRSMVEQLVLKQQIQNKVYFAGEVEDVEARLGGSSVFVLVSNWEGLPRSIIEAMRAGLPVIASDVGGVSELVVDGETGFLVPPGDKEVFAQRLSELLNSVSLREKMGLAGRMRYENLFTFEHMFEKTLSVYREVLSAEKITEPLS